MRSSRRLPPAFGAQSGIVVDQAGGVHGCAVDDLLDRGTLEEAFDGHFEFLAGAGVRDDRDLDDLVGDVAG